MSSDITTPVKSLSATKAWIISICIITTICVPLILGIGIARGWNVSPDDNTFQFKTVEDPSRFWPEPNAYEVNEEIDASIPGRDYPYSSGSWYYWKLRPVAYCQEGEIYPETLSCSVPEASAVTRAFVWVCYILHQCLIWGLIYKAQCEHKNDVNYHSNLKWYNVASLIVNVVFHLVHLLQTHITYDATAQDVSEASSQGSVIMLLCMVLLIEYKQRGMILGWPATNDKTCRCSWRLPTPPIELIRKYHGYAFAWATIYTLWYHPMESTVGHVIGFLHTGMLLIQQSLMFTPVHLNRYWRLLLETWVTIHGAVVAAQTQSKSMVGMFLFGFLWMVVFTQIHGLPYYLTFYDEKTSLAKWKRISMRLLPVVLYFAIVIICYATLLNDPDSSIGVQMTELVRIPPILYLFAVMTALVGWGMTSTVLSDSSSREGEEDNDESAERSRVGTVGTATVIAVLLVCYTIMVAVSVIFQTQNVPLNLMIQMIIFVTIFSILALVAMIVMEKDMKRIELGSPQLPPTAEQDGKIGPEVEMAVVGSGKEEPKTSSEEGEKISLKDEA